MERERVKQALSVVGEQILLEADLSVADECAPLRDLGVTSLDLVELIGGLSDALEVRVPRAELVKIVSLSDLLDAFTNALRRK